VFCREISYRAFLAEATKEGHPLLRARGIRWRKRFACVRVRRWLSRTAQAVTDSRKNTLFSQRQWGAQEGGERRYD